MKKIMFPMLAAVAIVVGCSRPGVIGDGVIKTETRTVTDFSKLEVEGGYRIEWASGKPALSISADENLLPLISTVVSGDMLRIDSTGSITATIGITIILTSSALADVNLTGGNTFIAGPVSGQNLKLESTGASDFTVSGSVTNLDATLTGAGKLKAKSLQTASTTLSLTGAGEAEVTATETLKVSITGAGSVTYSGHPKSVEKNILGAGSLKEQP
jgi:hypothetical protein